MGWEVKYHNNTPLIKKQEKNQIKKLDWKSSQNKIKSTFLPSLANYE